MPSLDLNSEQDFSFGSSSISYQGNLENRSPCAFFLCTVWAELDAVLSMVELVWMVCATPIPKLCDINGGRCATVLGFMNIMIASLLLLVSFSFQPSLTFYVLFKFILTFHHTTVYSPSNINNIKTTLLQSNKNKRDIPLSLRSPSLDSQLFVGKATDVSSDQMLSSRRPMVSAASSHSL